MSDWKDHVRVATTIPGTLSADFDAGKMIDGVTLAIGDRILIKNQSDAYENGIYTVNDMTAPTRATDADDASEVNYSMVVRVEEGDKNRGSVWYLTTPVTTLGSDDLVFARWNVVNVRDFGAVGDGSTDDTTALADAIATGSRVHIPAGTYLVGFSSIASNGDQEIFGDGAGATILLLKETAAGGKLLDIKGSNVYLHDLEISATGQSVAVTGNVQAVYCGTTSLVENIVIERVKFSDLSFSDGNSPATHKTHCIYAKDVANLTVRNCAVDGASGVAVFLWDVSHVAVCECVFKDTAWHAIHLESGVSHFDISHNWISCSLSTGMWGGGAINLKSAYGGERNQGGRISSNLIEGKYSFYTIISLRSCSNVVVQGNLLRNIDRGTLAAGDELVGIRLDTNGSSSSAHNGPCTNIFIRENTLDELLCTGASKTAGIYIMNRFAVGDPGKNIHIESNKIASANTTNYWGSGIIVNGFNGGFENIHVYGNDVLTALQVTPFVGGAIGFSGDSSTGTIANVFIGANTIADLGNGASYWQYGIGIDKYTDRVFNTATNRIDGFRYGVSTLANSGPTLSNLDDQNCTNIAGANYSFAVPLSHIHQSNISGPTASRPPSGNGTLYMMYFDTSLGTYGKPIWWSGSPSNWVDATGTSV